MREINRLTADKVTKLTTKAKPGRWADGAGLYLQISQWGTAAWVLRYMIDGRARHMGLGSLKDFPKLADARKRAETVRKMLKGGDDPTKRIDPIEAKRAARDKDRASARERLTFKEAAENFIDAHRPTWTNDKHIGQWSKTLNDYAYRSLGNRPVSAIDGAVINETLQPIWHDKPETARRVKQRIERVCQWIKDGTPLPQVNEKIAKHHAALPYRDLPAFMAELRTLKGNAARALEFCILTAARTDEVLGAKRDEIDEQRKLWIVPAERMKTRTEHRVPLSDRALKLLADLPEEAGNDFLFIGGKGGRLSHTAMAGVLKSIAGDYTVHGTARSCFKDWAVEVSNFPHEISEAALAHKISDKTVAAYERGDKLEKRKLLMQAWARYLDKPATAEVRPLQKTKAIA